MYHVKKNVRKLFKVGYAIEVFKRLKGFEGVEENCSLRGMRGLGDTYYNYSYFTKIDSLRLFSFLIQLCH